MGRKKKIELIDNEEQLVNLYENLNLDGFFKESKYSYLKAVYLYCKRNRHYVSIPELAEMVCGEIPDTITTLLINEECRDALDGVILHHYKNKEYDLIPAVVEDLRIAMAKLIPPGYHKVFLGDMLLGYMEEKTVFMKGRPKEILEDSKVLDYLKEMFLEDELMKNVFIISDNRERVLHQVKSLNDRNIHKKDIFVCSLEKEGYKYPINPLSNLKKEGGNYFSMACIIASHLIEDRGKDKVLLAMMECVVVAIMDWLDSKDKLTLPHVMAAVSILDEKMMDVLVARDKDTYLEFYRNLLMTGRQDIFFECIEKSRWKAFRMLSEEFCIMMGNPETSMNDLLEQEKESVWICQDDGTEVSALVCSVMLGIFIDFQQYFYREYYNGLERMDKMNNLIVVPDIKRILLKRLDVMLSLRNYNPFRLVVGYSKREDFFRHHDFEKLNELLIISSVKYGHWCAAENSEINDNSYEAPLLPLGRTNESNKHREKIREEIKSLINNSL